MGGRHRRPSRTPLNPRDWASWPLRAWRESPLASTTEMPAVRPRSVSLDMLSPRGEQVARYATPGERTLTGLRVVQPRQEGAA